MKRRSTFFSLIAFLLDLSSSTSAISLTRDKNFQPDKVKTKWSEYTSGPTETSLINEVFNSETRISSSTIGSQFTYSVERDSDEAERNAHVFYESWKDGPPLPKRSTKQLVKRSLEGLVTGGRDIEEAAMAAKAAKAAETLSDINKAREISGSSKLLTGADASKLGKADSFRGVPSRLQPAPALAKSKSLPSSLSPVIDQKGTLKTVNARFDKSVFELTDSVMTRPRPARTPLIAAVLENMDEPAYYAARQRPLTLFASFALYAEKELYQAVIDGTSDMKNIDRLTNIVAKERAIFTDELERAVQVGLNEKTFLNDKTVQDAHAEVVSLRKLTSANEVDPSQIKNIKKPPKGTRVSFPESMAADEARGKNTDILFQKPLMEITADEYFNFRYKPASSIDIAPAKDATPEKVKGLAITTMARDYLYESDKSRAAYKAARAARKTISVKNGVDYSLLTDVQEIFNEKGIPLGLRTPPKSKVLVWYDKFKAKFQFSLYSNKLKSMFSTAIGKLRVQPVPSTPVRSP
ncbi:hypothetical protein DFH28DRAFT_1084584 [Melampsora americana]|nr:hypothetical protein DFH28DRAFT_1084584 [Melampsora americana]